MPFVDETEIVVSSGHGGAGAATFRREKYVPKGGPDGGDGGRGGDVVFIVKPNLKTLAHLTQRREIRAENGKPGQKRKKHGGAGGNAIIEVPPGTIIRDAESGRIVHDMGDSEPWTFLKGGKGGRGNVWFKSSTRQSPRYAQSGLPGITSHIKVELNIIADIGFVGLPNAGKSTLLAALTNANPRIASYPFTTKTPNLGVLNSGYNEIVIADIPGIIEGASSGAGLGFKFLKHISRTKALALILDCSSETIQYDYETVLSELAQFEAKLINRPRIVVAAKADLVDRDDIDNLLTHIDEEYEIASAHAHIGLKELAERFADLCVTS